MCVCPNQPNKKNNFITMGLHEENVSEGLRWERNYRDLLKLCVDTYEILSFENGKISREQL